MTRQKLDSIFLTLMCFGLRTLILTSLYSICVFLTYGDFWDQMTSIFPFVILVHHGLSILYLLPAIFDWLLISGEIATWFRLRFYTFYTTRWSAPKDVILAGVLYVQIVTLLTLWSIRSMILFRRPKSNACLPFDLLALDQNIGQNWANSGLWQRNKNNLKERFQLMFGRTTWRSHYESEPGIFKTSRAALASILVLGLVVFTVFSVIVQPWHEAAVVPVKISGSIDLPWNIEADSPSWNVIVAVDRDINGSNAIEVPLFQNAIHVTPLWEDYDERNHPCGLDGSPQPANNKPQCAFIENKLSDSSPANNTPGFTAIYPFRYFCPNRCNRNLTVLEFVQSPARDTMPDLLVTVNFTTLGIAPLSSTGGGSRLKAVGIIIALTNNTDNALRSVPTSILPGMHLFGRVGIEFRSLSTNPPLSSFGAFSTSRTFLSGRIYDLTQDPAPRSQDNTTASLRIYFPTDNSDWIFVEDNREKSVLAGIAAVGGIWTSVSGIFAICFGGTLALVCWGKKPLSVFGLPHTLWGTNIRKEWKEKLQGIDASQGLDAKDRVLLKLLRERLVDLGPLEGV